MFEFDWQLDLKAVGVGRSECPISQRRVSGVLRTHGLRKEDEHPACTPQGHGTFYLYLYLITTHTVYNTIQDAILTCARKPTLIYRTEPATKNVKTEKLKVENRYAQK